MTILFSITHGSFAEPSEQQKGSHLREGKRKCEHESSNSRNRQTRNSELRQRIGSLKDRRILHRP